jgi:hypothetical protein
MLPTFVNIGKKIENKVIKGEGVIHTLLKFHQNRGAINLIPNSPLIFLTLLAPNYISLHFLSPSSIHYHTLHITK